MHYRGLPDRGWTGEVLKTIVPNLISTIDLSPSEAERLMVVVFNLRGIGGCYGAHCPIDPTGQHAIESIEPLTAGFWPGSKAMDIVVDGLSPWTIAYMKAHAALQNGKSLLASYQRGELRAGQPDSIGAVLWPVPLPSTNGEHGFLGYGVAVSGPEDNTDDHNLAVMTAALVERALFKKRVVAKAPTTGSSFIIQAPPPVR